MEEELKCGLCRRFFEDPLLLSCGHSLCRPCALKVSPRSSRKVVVSDSHSDKPIRRADDEEERARARSLPPELEKNKNGGPLVMVLYGIRIQDL